MVSTRQSSNVASSSSDPYATPGTSSGSSCEPVHTGAHSGGKLLRSGLSAPSTISLPLVPVNNEVILAQPSTSSPPSPQAQQQQQASTLNLLDLPLEILDKIFSFLEYKNVAHLRPVCRQLDKVCQAILNSTFQRLQHQMLHRFQSIKAKMPRRESARRNHPLACESDIIETLHMRLTLLQMTFGKHIERKHCCFFAGEILDEVNRILHYVKVTSKLARPYKVTDELFDLSTMAMEFFKEHIEPTLPEIAYFGSDFIDFSFPGNSPSNKYFTLDSPSHGSKGYESPASGNEVSSIDPQPVAQSNMVLRKRIKKIKQGMKRYSTQLTVMRRDLRTCKSKIADNQKQIVEYATRMDEYDKKNEETSRKFSTLLQELNKCKTELQYWRSKTPVIPPLCNNCGQLPILPAPRAEPPQPVAEPEPEPVADGFNLNIANNPLLEPIEFPAENEAGRNDDFWALYENRREQKQNQPGQQAPPALLDARQQEQPGPSSRSGKARDDKASPSKSTAETSKTMKRKLADEESAGTSTKKPKRSHKVRCSSKRSVKA